jgi:hypothetical protein
MTGNLARVQFLVDGMNFGCLAEVPPEISPEKEDRHMF